MRAKSGSLMMAYLFRWRLTDAGVEIDKLRLRPKVFLIDDLTKKVRTSFSSISQAEIFFNVDDLTKKVRTSLAPCGCSASFRAWL